MPWHCARSVQAGELGHLGQAAGHLEAACATWQRLLTDAPYLTSGRIDTALATLSARTRPYQKVPMVRALRERVSDLGQARERRR